MDNIKIFFILLLLVSCSYPEMIRDELIYENNFESNDLNNIDGGSINYFNKTNVLGNYNNDGFSLHVKDDGEHDYIYVSFDLYIHGSWDGNLNNFPNDDRPDLWTLELNPGMNLFNDSESNRFVTTFSNSPCYSNYCFRQSYPDNYPSTNNPKKGAHETGLEKICPDSFFGGESTLYKIEKIFKSSGKSFVLRFSDALYQPNAIDNFGVNQQKCDESWSLDNLKVRVIKYK